MLMAEPPERTVLLAATAWATTFAGELLVVGGRPGGGRNLLKLPPPTLDDVHDRSRWSGGCASNAPPRPAKSPTSAATCTC